MKGLIFGLIAGSIGMYILDPENGRRRRSMAMDKANKYRNKAMQMGGKKARDLSNRAQGTMHEAANVLQ